MSLTQTHSTVNTHKHICKSGMNADLACLFLCMVLVPLAVAATALGLTFLNTAT